MRHQVRDGEELSINSERQPLLPPHEQDEGAAAVASTIAQKLATDVRYALEMLLNFKG